MMRMQKVSENKTAIGNDGLAYLFTKGTTVLGKGPHRAQLMLVGQNPGREEVKQGRPFVGRSGQFLNRVLKEVGLERDKIYLTNVVKEPTSNNRKPTTEETRRWMPYLVAEINRVKPRFIVLMGQVAWKTPRLKEIEYIETYHPAAAMRFPKARQKFLADFGALKDKVAAIKGRGSKVGKSVTLK
jgi:uracil-DNA glycosylase